MSIVHIWTDGSFDEVNGAAWAFEAYNDDKTVLLAQKSSKCEGTNNIHAEITAVLSALAWAKDEGYTNIRIYHDYIGLQAWVNKTWAAKTDYTKEYVKRMTHFQNFMQIYFIKVIAHANDINNNNVDALAKARNKISLSRYGNSKEYKLTFNLTDYVINFEELWIKKVL